MPKRRRSRSRGRGGSGRFWQLVVLLGAVIAVSTLAFGVGAFTTADADRSASVGAASDQNSLIGLDLADSLSEDGDVECDVGPDPMRVTSTNPNIDVTTEKGVLVASGAKINNITAGTGVIVESDADTGVMGIVTTDGCVHINSKAQVHGSIDAGGDVTLDDNARVLDGNTPADSNRNANNNANDNANTDNATNHVTADGDVTLQNGAKINGDVVAGGDVILQSRTQITGSITADGEVITGGENQPQRLVTITNNFDSDVRVTIALRDTGDGTLSAPDSNSASGSGSTISFVLSSGASQQIEIVPKDSIGSNVRFTLDADTVDGGRTVSIVRSVPVVS